MTRVNARLTIWTTPRDHSIQNADDESRPYTYAGSDDALVMSADAGRARLTVCEPPSMRITGARSAGLWQFEGHMHPQRNRGMEASLDAIQRSGATRQKALWEAALPGWSQR